jgi:AraC-like DNA-binding protein
MTNNPIPSGDSRSQFTTEVQRTAASRLAQSLGTTVLRNVAEASSDNILWGQGATQRGSRRRRFPRIDFYYNQILGHDPQAGELPGHRHPWPELGTVVEGRLNIVWGTEVCEVRCGDWLAFPGDVSHAECCLTSRRPYRVFWFIFLPDGQLAMHETSYSRKLGYQLDHAYRLPETSPDLHRIVDRITQEESAELGNTRWHLIKLINWCLGGLMGDATKQADSYHPLIDEAKRILQQSSSRPPSVAELARSVGLSANYLSTLFHQQTGQTIREFVSNLRVEQACRCLADPTLSMKQICHQLGFATPQHFTHTFRRKTGMTPTAYRRDLLQGGNDIHDAERRP